eukprot:TRINITY_DN504_c0_g1_i4.p1 TRINITY_DN504_c0_g1~~TRINITY_DN504_c0_g1_i4.p1  ORF type:complete len:3491 (-),score=1220.27 TRINITY_DN504_c0_g1_i4:155-10627(-)
MKSSVYLLVFSALLFLAVESTHFRFGTITWNVASAKDWNTITFTVNTGWRKTYYDNLNYSPGHTSPNSNPLVEIGDNLVQPLNSIPSDWKTNVAANNYLFYTGIENIAFQQQYVTSKNQQDDWIMSTWSSTYVYPARAGTYVVYHTQTNRISTLKNNADQPWNITAKVTIAPPPNPIGNWQPNNSPTTSALPIIPVRYGTDLIYKLPGTDPDVSLGDSVVFSNANAAQMGGTSVCPELTVDADGTVRFLASKTNTIIEGAYQTQQLITDSFGAYVPVDYILNVTKQAGLCNCRGTLSTTICTSNANCTCTGGTCLLSDPTFIFDSTTVGKTTEVTGTPDIQTFDAGTFINIPIVADDPPFPATGYPVTIYWSGVPIGAVITTQKSCNSGTCMCKGTDCKNPQVVYYQWRTTNTTRGIYSTCFGVYQPKTSTYYAGGQTCITVNVVPPKCNSGTLTNSAKCNNTATFVASECCTCPPGYDASSRCLSCSPGFFGANCQPCPNCNNGTCSDGLGGNGQCVCDPGFEGIYCTNPNFKECDPSQRSYIQSQTTADGSILNPTSAFVYMAVNQSSQGTASVPYTLVTPSTVSLDVVFVQDLSSTTLTADITALSNKVGSLMNTLLAQYPGTAVSFASISGNPGSYRGYGPLTNNVQTLTGYISKMQINGTSQESTIAGLSGLSQVALDDSFQWRYNSYRVIVLLSRKADSGAITLSALSDSLASRSANVLYLIQKSPSAGASTYTTLSNNQFGLAAETASNQDDWNTVFVTQIANLVKQVKIAATKDTNGMFMFSPLTTAALGTTTTKSANFRFPDGVTKGTIRTLPNPTISFLGWASASVTIVLNRAPTSQNSVFITQQDTAYPFQIPNADADNNLLNLRFTRLPVNVTIYNNNVKVNTTARYFISSFNAYFIGNYLWSGNTSFSYILNDGCDNSAEYTAQITVTYYNYPPTVANFVVNLDQGTQADVSFTPYLSDVDDSVSSLKVYIDDSSKSSGSISTGGNTIAAGLVTNQLITYTPNPSFYGNASLTYRARDNTGQSVIATITFVVKFVNKNPYFTGSTSPTIAIGTTSSFVLTVTDVDIPDSAKISVASSLGPRVTAVRYVYNGANGAASNPIFSNVSSSPSGASFTVFITTDDSASGQLGTLTFTAADQYTGSATYQVTPVAALNTNPFVTSVNYVNTTGGSTYASSNNSPSTVVLTGDGSAVISLVASDNDGNQGAALSFTVVSFPSNGALFTGSNTPIPTSGDYVYSDSERTTVGKTSGYSITYKPKTFWSGTDSIVVVYKDVLGGFVRQTINFNVLFLNHNPSVGASDSVTLPIGANYTLSFTVSDPDTQDAESITVGAYSLTHVTGLWYSRSGVTTYLGTTLAKDRIIATGLNPSDAFNIIIQTDDTPSGSLGSFTLVAKDKFGGSGSKTVAFTAGNSAPPFVTIYNVTANVLEDGNITLSVTASDTDGKQGADLDFFISTAPAHGTLVTGKAKASVTVNSAFADTENTPATLPANSTSTYTFVYTPTKLYFGSDSIKFYVKDSLNTASQTYTTTFNVIFVNHNPVVGGPTQTTLPIGASDSFSVTINDPDTNDSESITITSFNLTHVTSFSVTAAGTTTVYDPTKLVGAKIANGLAPVSSISVQIGTDDTSVGTLGFITFRADDKFGGNGTFTVKVVAANNRVPFTTSYDSATVSLKEDQNITLTVAASDLDGNQGSSLSFIVVSLPVAANGKIVTGKTNSPVVANVPFASGENTPNTSTKTSFYTYTYVPTLYWYGTDSVTFIIKDALGGASVQYTTNFNVEFVNHPPILAGPSFVLCKSGSICSIALSIDDYDVDDTVDLILSSTNVRSGKVDNGSTLSVMGTDYPIDSNLTVTEGTLKSAIPTGNSGYTIFVKIPIRDTADGIIANFTFYLKDSHGGKSIYLPVNVETSTNNPPVLVTATSNSANNFQVLANTTLAIRVNGTDPDNAGQAQSLDLYFTSLPINGTIKVGSTNVVANTRIPLTLSGVLPAPLGSTVFDFSFVPNEYKFGKDSFSYYFQDAPGGQSIVYTQNIDVGFFNHPPEAFASSHDFTCAIGANCVITITVKDPDTPDSIALRMTTFTLASVDSASSTFATTTTTVYNGVTFTPNDFQTGLASGASGQLNIKIKDNAVGVLGDLVFKGRDLSGAESAPFSIRITAGANSPPYVIAQDPVNDVPLQGDGQVVVKINGSDVDGLQGQKLSLIIVSYPTSGKLGDSANRPVPTTSPTYTFPSSENTVGTVGSQGTSTYSVTYTPNRYFSGSDSFTYRLIDELGGTSDLKTMKFAVAFKNHDPEVTTISDSFTCAIGAVCTVTATITDYDAGDFSSLILSGSTLTSVEFVNATYTENVQALAPGETFTAEKELAKNVTTGRSVDILIKISDIAVGNLGGFTIYARDNHTGVSATKLIKITAGSNSPPVIVAQSPVNNVPVTGDSNVTVSVLGTDSDGNQGRELKFVILSLPSSGKVFTSKAGDSVSAKDFVFNVAENTPGDLAGKGSSNYSLVYVPDTYFVGRDFFTYAMVDALGSSTDVKTVQFDVAFFNHAPTIGTASTNVICKIGTNCTIDFTILDKDDPRYDSESIVLEAFSLTGVNAVYVSNPKNGSEFALGTQPQGQVLSGLDTVSTARLVINFASNINGPLGSFGIRAKDSYGLTSDSLSITITAENNNPPTLLTPTPTAGNKISLTLKEDGNLTISLTGTDQDGTQGSSLVLVIDSLPSNGKVFDSNKVRNTDGKIDPSTNVPFNGPQPGTSTSTYAITYIPDPLFSSVDTIVFHLVDLLGGNSVSYTLELNVTHVNHPPTGSSFSVAGFSGVSIPVDKFVGSDIDKIDVILLEIVTLPTNGTLFDADSIPISLGGKKRASLPLFTKDKWELSFISDDYVDGHPLTSFKFRFFDGQVYSDNYTATIDITSSNYPPVGYPVTLNGGLNQVVVFVANATDRNDAPGTLTINIVKGPSGGLLCSDEALFNCFTTGSIYRNESTPIYYKPNDNQFGVPYDYFTYTVSDIARATSDPVNATINIEFINKPPVFTAKTVITVFENDNVIFTLSATDDRTLSNNLKFVVLTSPLKGDLSISSDEGTEKLKESQVPLTLKESRTFVFAPYFLENGDNYASFNVSISDEDGGVTIVTIVFNVIPVNQPPEIHTKANKYTTRENRPIQFGFNGTDVDSPLETLVAVITRFPQQGTMHACANWTGIETDICEIGEQIVINVAASLQVVEPVDRANAIWRFVLVPALDESGKVYATPTFVLLDDHLAKSEVLILSFTVLPINKPPTVNASGLYTTFATQSISVPRVNVSDPDAGGLNVMVVISTQTGTLNFTSSSAFAPNSKQIIACRNLEEGKVLNCTATLKYFSTLLPTLTYTSSQIGTFEVTVLIDDLGSGAEKSERATSRLTATDSFKVQVDPLAVLATPSKNLSLVIGLASAGGALLAAAAVGAVARLVKKPDDSMFSNLLDFDSAAIVSNPLYEDNLGIAENPLYEDESAA